jgi:prepilin-type N-terminal cleavage/methylation domain-containing protein
MERRGEEGFSLIELATVVVIIAILIAVSVPFMLGARHRAQDREAQSNVRNGLSAERAAYTDTQDYTTDVAKLADIESSLTFVGNNTPAEIRKVYVHVAGAAVYIGARSASGSCFYLRDDSSSPTMFAIDSDGACADLSAATYSLTKW